MISQNLGAHSAGLLPFSQWTIKPEGFKISRDMPTKPRFFDLNFYYHIYNCGIEKRNVFLTNRDYQRFLETVEFYLHEQRISFAQFQNLNADAKQTYRDLNPKGLETLRVKLISYCSMPNHFHLVLKPAKESGLTNFLSDLANSYTRYFNLKNKRIGALFQGPFKAKEISSEESLLQLTRYVHLNPSLSPKTSLNGSLRPENYPLSSYRDWIGLCSLNPKGLNLLDFEEISKWVGLAGGQAAYKEFVEAKTDRNPALGVEDLILE